MQIRNSEFRYGIIAILFHWLMGLLIIGLLGLGFYMSDLTFSVEKLRYYGIHKSLGIWVLLLVLIRLSWRFSHISPSLLTTRPNLENFAALAAHTALYLCMFLMPLTGWNMTSAAGFPVSFFGLFMLPTLVEPSAYIKELFVQLHSWAAIGFIGIIVLHIAAAFQHHFIYKNNILRRMWP